MDWGKTLLILLPLALLILLVRAVSRSDERTTELLTEMNRASGRPFDALLLSGDKGLGINQSDRLFVLAAQETGGVNVRPVPFSALTGSSVHRSDSNSVMTKKTGFATFTSSNSVNAVSLHVTFADMKSPLLVMDLFTATGSPKLDDPRRDQALAKANEWHSRLSGIATENRNDREQVPSTSVETESLAVSLERLTRLHLSGALSNTEFEAAKERVISGRARSKPGEA